MAEWGQTMPKHKAWLGMDANETFTATPGGAPIAHTSRGEEVLQWTTEWGVQLPPQDLATPTFHPYNTTMQSRRLDYLFQKGHAAQDGGVHVCLVRSRRGVGAGGGANPAPTPPECTMGSETAHCRQHGNGSRFPTPPGEIGGTRMLTWQTLRQSSPSPGGGYDKFRESKQLQAQRRAAQRMGQEGGAARTAWKAISRARKQEQRAWQQANVLRASQMDWRAKRTLDHHTAGRDGSTVSWTTATGRTSSGGISRASSFRTPQSSTAARLQDIRAALSKACKQHRWRPFTEEELRLATATWHRGKATGPDGISLEALMTLLQDVRWTDRLRYIFNDFLDRGSLPPAVQEGVTVLLPKTVGAPQTWGHEAHYAVLRGA